MAQSRRWASKVEPGVGSSRRCQLPNQLRLTESAAAGVAASVMGVRQPFPYCSGAGRQRRRCILCYPIRSGGILACFCFLAATCKGKICDLLGAALSTGIDGTSMPLHCASGLIVHATAARMNPLFSLQGTFTAFLQDFNAPYRRH